VDVSVKRNVPISSRVLRVGPLASERRDARPECVCINSDRKRVALPTQPGASGHQKEFKGYKKLQKWNSASSSVCKFRPVERNTVIHQRFFVDDPASDAPKLRYLPTRSPFDQLLVWFVYFHDPSLFCRQPSELLRGHMMPLKVKALRRRECIGDSDCLRELGRVGGGQQDLHSGWRAHEEEFRK
jgi:hypothetical protein